MNIELNMKQKIGLVLLICYMLGSLYLIREYSMSKVMDAERFSDLIAAGKKCYDSANRQPNTPLPLCEVKLKDILIIRSFNPAITELNLTLIGGLNGTNG